MKAEEVLKRYQAGERNFRRVNLQGQSFKGKDLSEADFSEAKIQGANFTNAKLKGTNFSHIKAGLSYSGFKLPNGANRSPDVSWVRRERWEALTTKQREKFVPLYPDFVVELLSPSAFLKETQEKMQEYINNGAMLGWLIIHKSERVEIYRPNRDV